MFRTLTAAAALIGLVMASPARATLIGDQITAVYNVPTSASAYSSASFTPPTFTVGAGQETVGNVEGVTTLGVDFTADTLAITLNTTLSNPRWNSAAFNGIVFTATSPLGITGATIDSASTMAGFDSTRVSLNPDQILIDWNGLSYSDGTVVKVDFTFAPDGSAAIPEPATIALLGTALFGLGTILRRRSTKI